MKLAASQRPLTLWLLLGGALLLGGGYLAFHQLFVKVGRSVEQPFSGPAGRDPYYVLGRYLEERGVEVESVRNWPQPLPHDRALFWFSHDELPDEVRTWLSQGGQLWSFRDPDVEEDAYDWEPSSWSGEPDGDASQREAADGGGAEAGDGSTQATTSAPDPAAAAEPSYCTDGCLAAAQFRCGEGCLTLVSQYALENERVILGETPARVDALLTCPRRPRAVLIVTSIGSVWFGQLLFAHASEALLAAALALALALWRAAVYFGPRLPPPTRERRRMLEHIAAIGSLSARVGYGPLLRAARRALHRRLLRQVPHASSMSEDALVQAVHALTELPTSEVRRALLDPPESGPHAPLAIARAVQALWRKT